VPLPFLTTEGAHEEHPPQPDAVRARRAGERWHRPYAVGPHRVATAAVLLVLTTYLLIASLVVDLAGNGARSVVLLCAAVLVTATALRLLRVGVWVSGDGLRVVTLMWTTTLGWDEIGSVRTAQQPVRWLAMPRTVQGQALLIHRVDGSEVPVVLTDRSPDFFGHTERFDVAADTIEDWAAVLRRA
jgi:hypothetical protein